MGVGTGAGSVVYGGCAKGLMLKKKKDRYNGKHEQQYRVKSSRSGRRTSVILTPESVQAALASDRAKTTDRG